MQGRRPDPATAFRCSSQAEAADLLADCVRGGEPIVVLTGAAGLGKTLVLDLALARLGETIPRVLRLEPPFPAPLALQQRFATALRLPDPGAATPAGLAQALLLLEPPAPEMASVVVVIDGAEAASGPLLHYLWLMQSLTALGRPALQLLLVGRDALWRQLGEEPLAGLRRGISARLALQPLAEPEAAALLQHLAGQRRRHIDPDAAADMLVVAAGVPGRLSALLDAACVGLPPRRRVTLAAVRAMSAARAPEPPPPLPTPAAAAWPSGRAAAWAGLRSRPSIIVVGVAGLLVLVLALAWRALPVGRLARPGAGTASLSRPAAPPPGKPPAPAAVQRTASGGSVAGSLAAHARLAAAPPPSAAPPPAVAAAPPPSARRPVPAASVAGPGVPGVRWAALDAAATGAAPPLSLADSAQLAGAAPPPPSPPPVRIDPAARLATLAAAPPPPPAAVPDPPAMVVLADATAPRVLLLYPRGDAAARARAAEAAQALRAQGVDAADPQPAARTRRQPGIGYFFGDDLDSAREIARKLAGRFDPGRVEALPMPSAPPPPGTLEILLADH